MATRAPAAILTCRSSDITFRPRTTGMPAASQAAVPPSTLITFWMPAASSFSQAFWLRPPDLQTKYTGPSPPSAAISRASSRSSGMLRAKSTCTSPNSAGVRTSMSMSFPPWRRRSARFEGVIVATIENPSCVSEWDAGRAIVPQRYVTGGAKGKEWLGRPHYANAPVRRAFFVPLRSSMEAKMFARCGSATVSKTHRPADQVRLIRSG